MHKEMQNMLKGPEGGGRYMLMQFANKLNSNIKDRRKTNMDKHG